MMVGVGSQTRAGGTATQASRNFRRSTGSSTGGALGMLTVYGYGFEAPVVEVKPPTPWGTYLLLAAAGWWAWKRWGHRLRGGDGL